MAGPSTADGHQVAIRRLKGAVLAAVFTVVGVVAPPPATAEDAPLPPATPGPPPEVEPEVPTTTPEGVPLAPPGADEAGRQQALAQVRLTEKALKQAVNTSKKLARQLPPLRKRQEQQFFAVLRLHVEDRAAAEALAAARDRVRQMAVAGYVIGGDVPPVDYLLRSESPSDFVRRSSLVRNATEAKADALDVYQAAKENASSALLDALSTLDAIDATVRRMENEIAVAQAAVDELTADLAHRRQLLDVITAAAPVGESDIPRLVLDAYKRAAATLAKKVPHCRVGWTSIAAIGKVESNHGRYKGAQLALNGDVYPRILGIPLDGTRGTRVIKDTDKGELDLDLVYDRAVGPMQFIPSTWVRIAQDGNADAIKDANNIYDGALGTAAYLCRAVPSGGLDLEEHIKRAFFSYNHSDKYVEYVYGWKLAFDAMAAAGSI